MAENKKSFVLYSDNYGLIKQLPDEIAGKLIKHIFAYVNDEDPKSDDLLLNVAFEPIKMALKRDLKKYETTKEIKSQGGRIGNLKRWNKDLYEQVISKKISLEEAEKIAENRKTSHTDNNRSHTIAKIAVNVSDSDSVNVSDSVTSNKLDVVVDKIDINEKFENDFSDFKISYYFKSQNLNFSLENEIVNFTTQLQNSKNEFEKKLFTACLEFLEFEKRKKVPQKKENNIDTANELKISSEWLEAMAMQFKVSIETISNKLDEFLLHLKTDCKEHTSRGEFIKHFKSWLLKNMSNGTGETKKSDTSSKQSFRFSVEELAKAKTGAT